MQVDLSVELVPPTTGLAGLHLKNPILVASGTFGYGVEFAPGKIAKREEEEMRTNFPE